MNIGPSVRIWYILCAIRLPELSAVDNCLHKGSVQLQPTVEVVAGAETNTLCVAGLGNFPYPGLV